MKTTRWWLAPLTLAAAVGMIDVAGIVDAVPDRKPIGSRDQPEDDFGPPPPVDKDLKINVKNTADLLKKRNQVAAKSLAASSIVGLEEFYDLALMYRPRNKGGMGWGSIPQPNPAQDGLERRLIIFARGVPQNALGDPANEESALWIAAIAEMTIAMAPKKDAGKKTRKLWISQAEELRESAYDLRKASAANNAAQMKQAAIRITNTCTACHIVFRD